jgi:hypothetical protein
MFAASPTKEVIIPIPPGHPREIVLLFAEGWRAFSTSSQSGVMDLAFKD